jgi:hypothetical protein
MRGMDETYGMGAGASVRKGKTAKQVRRARKAIDAGKKKMLPTAKSVATPPKKRPDSMADKIGKPTATPRKAVSGPRTKLGAKSFTTRMDKPTSAAKARKAKPRQGY